MDNGMNNKNRFLLNSVMMALLLTGLWASPPVGAQDDAGLGVEAARTAPWPEEAVHLFATLPIQDGGRIKPLESYANVALLKFNGKRSCKDLSGNKLRGIEWFMDCLFFPEDARQYKTFRVDNSDVMTALGLPYSKRRDRYAYADIEPGRVKLLELARGYSSKPNQQRSLREVQIVNLADNLMEFEGLARAFEVARLRVNLSEAPALAALFDGATEVRLSELLPKSEGILTLLRGLGQEDKESANYKSSLAAIEHISHTLENATALALFPPVAQDAKEWISQSDIAASLFRGTPPEASLLPPFGLLEELAESRNSMDAFAATAAELHANLSAKATQRGEYRAIPLEVAYHKAKFVSYSLYGYVLCFVVVAFSWLRPKSKGLYAAGLALLTLPTLYLAIGITVRCLIRLRPPVTTLYETILFVAWCAVATCVFIEVVGRRKMALSMGAFVGILGLFLAYKYELQEGVDTMPSMVAVLDTNFWLATHVTTIIIGYAAGLLAAAMSHLFVFGKLLRVKDTEFFLSLNRTVYGVLCFSLLFSVVGTILGGIWANESWGRFWGWDPKENGALMICLWQLALIHAYRGHYIHSHGLHLAAIAGGIVIAFSWFGVNLLGVGLHSYGFTSGISQALLIFYVIEGVALALGGLAWILEKPLKEAAEDPPLPSAQK
jgi:ABC-type transport system involved in cytochrome c biogenesis permease subunit